MSKSGSMRRTYKVRSRVGVSRSGKSPDELAVRQSNLWAEEEKIVGRIKAPDSTTVSEDSGKEEDERNRVLSILTLERLGRGRSAEQRFGEALTENELARNKLANSAVKEAGD